MRQILAPAKEPADAVDLTPFVVRRLCKSSGFDSLLGKVFGPGES